MLCSVFFAAHQMVERKGRWIKQEYSRDYTLSIAATMWRASRFVQIILTLRYRNACGNAMPAGYPFAFSAALRLDQRIQPAPERG